jgi:hypothetical protein
VPLDPLCGEIRGYPELAKMIRERKMIPGLSTHLPQSVVITDQQDYDAAACIQICNAADFTRHSGEASRAASLGSFTGGIPASFFAYPIRVRAETNSDAGAGPQVQTRRTT